MKTKNNHILVIDDDKNIWKSYQSVLNKKHASPAASNLLEDLLLQGKSDAKNNHHDYELSFAQQGEEGFLKLKTAQSEGKPFALVFIDIRMPPGWNGVKTACAIRAIDTQVEIVIVTAFADISRTEIVAKIGQPDKLLYLRKPFDAEELSQIALQLTAKWRLSAEQRLQQQKIEKLLKELQQTRNYLDSMINSMAFYLIGVSDELLVTHWNQATTVDTGISPETAMGSKLSDLLTTNISLEKLIRVVIDTNTSQHVDKVMLILNDEEKMCEINLYPLRCKDETQNTKTNNRGAVIRIDDITERNKLEEIMIQSDKMLTVGGLAAGMAHEINTPLGSIIQSAQVIANRLDKDNNKNKNVAINCELDIEKLDQYMNERGIFKLLDGISDGVSRTSKIVKSMLSFSHQGSIESYHQLNEIIDEALILAKSDYDLKKHYHFMNFNIIKNYADNLPQIKFDRTKLEQVILNLLKNAAHAMSEMPDGHKPRIEISTASDSQNIIIKLKDNGPGIKDEIKKRIFDPFFTTKEVGLGTGLGLSLAYFIINHQHNGLIQMTSTLGQGAEFIISLPFDPATVKK